MKTLNIAEARGRFSELVEDVYGGGGPVVVSRYGHPMVMIVPAQVDPPEKPDPFPLRGVPLEIPPDFDEPMDSLWDALSEPAPKRRGSVRRKPR